MGLNPTLTGRTPPTYVLVLLQVQRILPQWLAKPDVINRDIKSNLVPISEIQGISAQLVKKLENNGIQHFFPGDNKD